MFSKVIAEADEDLYVIRDKEVFLVKKVKYVKESSGEVKCLEDSGNYWIESQWCLQLLYSLFELFASEFPN